MYKNYKIYFSFLLVLMFAATILSPLIVCAGPLTGASNNLRTAIAPTGLSDNLTDTVATVIKGVLALVGSIFFIFTVYAGVLWLTSQGNVEQVEKSTGIIKAAIIGLAITMSAYAITAFVTGRLNP